MSLKPAVVWKFIQSTLKMQIFFLWNPQNHPRSATEHRREVIDDGFEAVLWCRGQQGETESQLRGGLTIDLQLFGSVNKQISAHIHHEAIMVEKICSQNGNSNICYDENPRKRPPKTEIKCEGSSPKSCINSVICSVKC